LLAVVEAALKLVAAGALEGIEQRLVLLLRLVHL
jgi:hypothetical protein